MADDPKKLILDESVMVYKISHNLLVHYISLAESNQEGIF